MIKLNLNANIASAGGASSIGALNNNQAQLVQSSPQLKAMDKMAAEMTAPGGNSIADLSKKLETVNLDSNAKFAQGMQQMGAANSYLDECQNQSVAPQGKPLSGMQPGMEQGNKLTSPNAVPNPAPNPNPVAAKPAAESNSAAAPKQPIQNPAAQNPIGQCLESCFGDQIPASERQSIADFYGQAASKNPQPQLGAPQHLPHAPQTPQAPGAKPAAVPPQAPPPPRAPQGQTVAPKNPPLPSAQAAKVPAQNEPAVRPEVFVREEIAPNPSFEDMASRFGLDGNIANNFGAGDPQQVNSVLSQYMQHANMGAAHSEVAAALPNQEFAAGADMGFNPMAGLGTSIAEGMALPTDAGNPLVNAEGAPRQFNAPIDMVGSTAMSTNMANLEQLVNMDLMEKFTSGMTMQ